MKPSQNATHNIWNSLPVSVRDSHTQTVSVFKIYVLVKLFENRFFLGNRADQEVGQAVLVDGGVLATSCLCYLLALPLRFAVIWCF